MNTAPTPLLLAEPASMLMTGDRCTPCSDDLSGWPEGRVTRADWLDAGGPLDAPDRLPTGHAYAVQHDCGSAGIVTLISGSVRRARSVL